MTQEPTSKAASDTEFARPNPDALQDVPMRERGATSLSPERPEAATATGVRGGQSSAAKRLDYLIEGARDRARHAMEFPNDHSVGRYLCLADDVVALATALDEYAASQVSRVQIPPAGNGGSSEVSPAGDAAVEHRTVSSQPGSGVAPRPSSEQYRVSPFHHRVAGREEPFEDEAGRYVATLRVVLSHRPGVYDWSDDGLKCVAERAAHGAAAAYNFFDTRIVTVEVVDVEAVV